MTTALQPSRMPLAPAIAKEFEIQPAEWRVLVEQIFPSARTVEAVMMALAYCKRRQLDIYKRPVHIVPMYSAVKGEMVETVWPGIAEIRTTASRTGEYAGIDAVEFGPLQERKFVGEVEKWVKPESGGRAVKKPVEVTKIVRYPEWASVVVYRMNRGVRCAYHAKIFWEETYASIGRTDLPNEMWSKRPRGQLDKCVEAAALRKAFPEELGNTYAAEEMEGRSIDAMSSVTIEHEAVPATAKPSMPYTITNAPEPPVPPEEPEEDKKPTDPRRQQQPKQKSPDSPREEPEPDPDNNPTDYFTLMEDRMAAEAEPDDVQAVWEEMDSLARFDGDDENQGIALGIYRRHIKRVGGIFAP